MKIGLIVNPVAGLGGPLGLKGSDGLFEVPARPRYSPAGERARRAFDILAARLPGLDVDVASGSLGSDITTGLALRARPLDLPVPTGTAQDTRTAVRAMSDADLVVFCGGDGTARDVASALAPGRAMLGIPAGVKMQSGVFAATPEAAGHLLADILSAPERVRWRDDAEIMDIDEAALREGQIGPRLYGLARAPQARGRMQAAKGTVRHDDEAALAGAAREIAAMLDPAALTVIGPGRSAGLVATALRLSPTLLGVDAVLGGRMVAADAGRKTLDGLAEGRPVTLVLGVTGRQGFLIGRGNQQIGPDLVRWAGRDGLIVLASQAKLQSLDAPVLHVDSGDPDLDASMRGFLRVRTGPSRSMLMRVGAP